MRTRSSFNQFINLSQCQRIDYTHKFFYTNTGHLHWVYYKELSLSAEIQTPDGIVQASSTSAS